MVRAIVFASAIVEFQFGSVQGLDLVDGDANTHFESGEDDEAILLQTTHKVGQHHQESGTLSKEQLAALKSAGKAPKSKEDIAHAEWFNGGRSKTAKPAVAFDQKLQNNKIIAVGQDGDPKSDDDVAQAEEMAAETFDIPPPEERGYLARAREDVVRELASDAQIQAAGGEDGLMHSVDREPQNAPWDNLHADHQLPTEDGDDALLIENKNASLIQSGGACRDDPAGWYDSDGANYNCAWYGRGSHCSSYGNGYRNMGKTANQACCSCGGGSNQAVEYYAFSHRTLTIGDLVQAKADGVNAIEIDVTAWWNECTQSDWETAGCWWAQHDGNCHVTGGDFGGCTPGGSAAAAGDRLDTMLQWIRNNGVGHFGAVMIDIKNPDWCDPDNSYYKQCSVKMLKELAGRILGGYFNVVYDVYGQFSGVGYKWLQRNYDKCLESTDQELETDGGSWPHGMAKTFTYGGSFAGSGWCGPLETAFKNHNAKVAAHWTITTASQVVTNCGNAIILGHTLYAYSAYWSSWKSVVDKAKQIANERGFTFVRNKVSWC